MHDGHAATNGHSDSVPGANARDAWSVDGFAPLPGDTVSLPDGVLGRVETVYLCAEPAGDDVTHWTWVVLADGRLIEVAPRGCALYDRPQVLARGTGPFLELVAQDGALVRFEERVRAGTWEARPVRLMLDGRRWRVTSTGTVTAQRLGLPPASAWSQLGTRQPPSLPTFHVTSSLPSPSQGEGREEVSRAWDKTPQHVEEPDVYFTLDGLADADALGLGLWATDVILAFGRRLGGSPLKAGLSVTDVEPAP